MFGHIWISSILYLTQISQQFHILCFFHVISRSIHVLFTLFHVFSRCFMLFHVFPRLFYVFCRFTFFSLFFVFVSCSFHVLSMFVSCSFHVCYYCPSLSRIILHCNNKLRVMFHFMQLVSHRPSGITGYNQCTFHVLSRSCHHVLLHILSHFFHVLFHVLLYSYHDLVYTLPRSFHVFLHSLTFFSL